MAIPWLGWRALVLPLTGALGSLFGADVNRRGFDLGALGGTVLAFVPWLGDGLFAAGSSSMNATCACAAPLIEPETAR